MTMQLFINVLHYHTQDNRYYHIFLFFWTYRQILLTIRIGLGWDFCFLREKCIFLYKTTGTTGTLMPVGVVINVLSMKAVVLNRFHGRCYPWKNFFVC